MIACSSSCATCNDANTCLSCVSPLFFYKFACLNTCPSGTVEATDPFLHKICVDNKDVETTAAIVVGKSTQTASTVAVQTVSAVSSGSSFAISARVSGKIFSNIKYLNISYPLELENAFRAWSSSPISFGLALPIPNFTESDIEANSVPYVFEKYETNATFIINFWENFVFLCIYSGIFGIFKLIELIVPYSKITFIRRIIQNFLLTQFYNVFGDLVFFSVLDYRIIDSKSGTSIFSFFISLFLLIVMCSCFVIHINILRKYQRVKIKSQDEKTNKTKLSRFLQENSGNQIFFRDFKDTTLLHQSFLLIFTIQDILFALILTTLFNSPLVEVILILFLNLMRLLYLVTIAPFKDILDAANQLFYEAIILSVNISVLILAISEAFIFTSEDLKVKTGKLIIIANLIFNFGTLAIILVQGILAIKETWKSYKNRKQIHNEDKTNENLNPNDEQNKNSITLDFSSNQSFLSEPNIPQSNQFFQDTRLLDMPSESNQHPSQKIRRNIRIIRAPTLEERTENKINLSTTQNRKILRPLSKPTVIFPMRE